MPRTAKNEMGPQRDIAGSWDEPDVKLGGFSLWVCGREFPDANDYWDGNWLNVRARVEAPGALVEAQGGFIHAPALADFAKQVETLHATLVGEAVLRRMGPNLAMAIRGDSLGHMELRLMITPDHLTQAHDFKFDLDQTYLGPFLDGCKSVLSCWPVRPKTSA
jgi:hypothetical protein